VDVQDCAFVSLSSRRVESEHVAIKHGSTQGFRHTYPAMTCARARSPQTLLMLDSAAGMDFVIMTWNSRTIWSELLEHELSKPAIAALPTSKRHAKVYRYAGEDHFHDHSELSSALACWSSSELKNKAQPAIPLSPLMGVVIEYFKSRLAPNDVVSVPAGLLLSASAPCEAMPEALTNADVLHEIRPRPAFGAAVADLRFFRVVDTRPENKVQIKSNHLMKQKTLIKAVTLKVISDTDDGIYVQPSGLLCVVTVVRLCLGVYVRSAWLVATLDILAGPGLVQGVGWGGVLEFELERMY
jgi:hypothetical protein